MSHPVTIIIRCIRRIEYLITYKYDKTIAVIHVSSEDNGVDNWLVIAVMSSSVG